MGRDAIPIVKLPESDVTLAEVAARYEGQTIALQIPRSKSVLLLLPSEDYRYVRSAIEARRALPARPSRTPAEYFAETVHVLRRFEREHGMTSAEFYRRFQEGALVEDQTDYWEWRTRYRSLVIMRERFGFSEAEVADA